MPNIGLVNILNFKISNTFLFLFSNKMLAIKDGSHKILFRIVNREDAYIIILYLNFLIELLEFFGVSFP